MSDPIRLRKTLSSADPAPVWPDGAQLAPLAAIRTDLLHAILVEAYASGFGSEAPLDVWWPAIAADSEYDESLVFVAIDQSGAPVGFALCWTSGFIKDLAVAPYWRGRGLGEALLRTAFNVFRQRGLAHVDLKVVAENATAIRLYRRLGMVEAPL
jgi:ribosomal protein S18 acetylase RimI-like enzyme